MACLLVFLLWRRRRDSNPRDPFESNGFQDRRIQPLCHSSTLILLHLLAACCTFARRHERLPPILKQDWLECSAVPSQTVCAILTEHYRVFAEGTKRSGKRGSMKLIVLGATGSTGMEIVRQSIEHGYSVTTFVRSPERLKPFRDRITIKQGNLLDPAGLEEVIKGHDAVLSAFGPRVPISKADANLLQQFAVALTSAMPRARVKRVVSNPWPFCLETQLFLRRISLADCSSRALSRMPPLWRACCKRAGSTGLSRVHLN
jgi:hypothetical protein